MQAHDINGGRGRDMLEVGFGQADVARAAQPTEPDALRQAALDPGAHAVERSPLRRLLVLARLLDRLMPVFEAEGQPARGDFGPCAQGSARADPVREDGLDALGAPIVHSRQPVDALVPLRAGHDLGVPVNREGRDVVALTGLGLPAGIRANGTDQLDAMLCPCVQ